MHCTRTWRASSVVKKLNNSNLVPPKNLKIWNSAGNYFNPPLFELIVYSKKGLDHFGGTMTEIISWPSLSIALCCWIFWYGTHSFGQSLRGYLEDLDCVRFPVWWPNVRGKQLEGKSWKKHWLIPLVGFEHSWHWSWFGSLVSGKFLWHHIPSKCFLLPRYAYTCPSLTDVVSHIGKWLCVTIGLCVLVKYETVNTVLV